MRHTHLLAVTAAGMSASFAAFADIHTLSSDEMVETYVQDSAVIVIPGQHQEAAPRPSGVTHIVTISPGEPVLSKAEEEASRQTLQRYIETSQSGALADAEDEFLRRALLLPQEQMASVQPPSDLGGDIAPLIYGQQIQVPEEAFQQSFLNDQLGIGFDGENLNFSIGTPPGIGSITVPQAITEGPVRLTPRPGGGFDLSIAVPEP